MRFSRFFAVATGVSQSLIAMIAVAQGSHAVPGIAVNPEREAYYGDLHLHTNYSFDAYLWGTTVDPGAAYRFARGEAVNYLGQPARRREPLDFMAVTDHAENIGIVAVSGGPSNPLARTEFGQEMLKNVTSFAAAQAAHRPLGGDDMWKHMSHLSKSFFGNWPSGRRLGPLLPEALQTVSASAWQREIDFANRYYEPGKFTTFIAYEWTAQPNNCTLHRNVIFKGNSAPLPFTAQDSDRPEDLWLWLEGIRERGYEALAIPHNANFSNGLMYDWMDSDGGPIDEAYAEERQANEPLSEISQTKGTSEVHPLLAPNDEFANFQIIDTVDPLPQLATHTGGSYLRDALGRGLVLERRVGANPYKYGFVGASDLHTGLSVSDQTDYRGTIFEANLGGGVASREEVSVLNGADIKIPPVSILSTSGNLTGVWAESNTREAIYAALRRRETFATTGTRLKFRFFGGWTLPEKLITQKDWVETAYKTAVPMGSDLASQPQNVSAPSFAIWAIKDPNGANLDRVQVIKVWEEDGKQKDRVFDAVWSGHRQRDSKTGKIGSVGNTVDLKTGRYTNDIGAAELETVWRDPEFNPHRLAAYYLRVLEIHTARWSTLLAIRNGLPLPKDVPATEQQRGWSSPVWYTPTSKDDKHRRSPPQ